MLFERDRCRDTWSEGEDAVVSTGPDFLQKSVHQFSILNLRLNFYSLKALFQNAVPSWHP